MANQQSIDDISKDIIKQAAEDLIKEENNGTESLEHLKKATNDLINYLNNMNQTYLNTSLNKYSKSNITALENFINNIEDKQQLIIQSNKYKELLWNFKNAIDEFLNREICLTLVDEEGSIVLATTQLEELLYKKATGNFQIPGYKNIIKDNSKLPKDKQKEYVKDFNFEITNNIKNTYLNALQRYNSTIIKSNNIEEEKSNYHFIFWHLQNNHRKYAYVQSRGSIVEGYVYAIIENDAKQQKAYGMEQLDSKDNYSHQDEGLKLLYERYIQKVDNASGLLHGDIVYNNIEYAVKGKGASFEGRAQYFYLAEAIKTYLEQGKILDKEKLIKLMNSTLVGGKESKIPERAINVANEKVVEAFKTAKKTGSIKGSLFINRT